MSTVKGLHSGRTDCKEDPPHPGCLLERAYAELWEEENQAPRFGGGGILQALMLVPDKSLPKGSSLVGVWNGFDSHPLRAAFVIEERDQIIAATLIQWLGSNIGRCFVEEAYRRAGWRFKTGFPNTEADRL